MQSRHRRQPQVGFLAFILDSKVQGPWLMLNGSNSRTSPHHDRWFNDSTENEHTNPVRNDRNIDDNKQ